MTKRRWAYAVVAVAMAVPGPAVAVAATSGAALSPRHPATHWTGGRALSTADETHTVELQTPASYWRTHPGGLTVRIDWVDAANVLELAVYDPQGKQVAFSGYGNVTHQQVYLAAPASGRYLVQVIDFAGADTTYRGTARLVGQRIGLANQHAGGMQFSRSLADPQILTADPGVSTDTAGRVYVSSRQGEATPTGSFLWRSTDAARTFALVGDGIAGPVRDPRYRPCAAAVDAAADIDVVPDRTGRLYLADVGTASLTAGYSTDHGRTWTCAPVPAASGSDDRPWIAAAPSADGAGPGVDAYLSYQFGAFIGELPGTSTVSPEGLRVAFTRDGGRSWQPGGAFAVGQASIPGELFAGPHGEVDQVFAADDSVWLARSRDSGRTFTVHLVSRRLGDPRGDGWPAGGVDGHGALYVAWVDEGSWVVLLSRSTDGGRHWSAPAQVSPPGTTAMKVWLTTGRTGDIAVAWYGAGGTFPLYVTPPSTAWYVWAARSVNAGARRPTFSVARVTPLPVGVGPEREVDNGAETASQSYFGDALRVAIAPGGGLIVSYADVGFATAQYSAAYVTVARQTSGLGMSSSAVRRAATWHEHPTSGPAQACSALTFRGRPALLRHRDAAFRLRFGLASTSQLAAVPTSCAPPGTERDAMWIATWRTNGHREYAGMAVQSGASAPTFFGGTDPAMVYDPTTTAPLAASYPAALSLTGRVDTASKAVTISLTGRLRSRTSGARLQDLQLFSLLGNARAVTPQTLLRIADETPSLSLQLP